MDTTRFTEVEMRKEENLRVEEVEFVPIKPREGLIGFASCLVDRRFYFAGIGVHTVLNGEGLRITYPTRKVGDTNIPLYHPVNAEVGDTIRKAITRKVKELLGDAI